MPIITPKFEKHEAVIFDTITGLTWETQVRDGDPQQVVASVNIAMVGGFADWRVPSIQELETITDLSRMNPAVYPIFGAVPPGSYRSSTLSQRSPVETPSMYIWVTQSIDGRSVHEQPRANTHMRLVRSSWAPPPIVIVDDATAQQGKVLWKRYRESMNMTPRDAVVFAAQDRTGGRAWRLPTLQEALNRMDRTLTTYPVINTHIFPLVPLEPMWTSTPALDVGHNNFFWGVDPNGMSQPIPPQFAMPVWLVSDTTDVSVPIPTPVPTPIPVPTPVPVPVPTGETLEQFRKRLIAFINA